MPNRRRQKRKLEKTTWVNISFPKQLIDKIDKVYKKLYGYDSRAEYARDALRRKVQSDEITLRMEKDEDDV